MTDSAPTLPIELVRNCRVLPNREGILRYLPKNIVFVEIGVALGDFSERVLAACSIKRFVGIDIFTLHHYPETWDGYVGRTLGELNHRSFYERRFRSEIEAGRVTVLEGSSTEKLEELDDRSVDVFYVDADHAYEAVKAELSIIKRKIIPGGIIILNDYTLYDQLRQMPYGVIQAAHEFMLNERWELIFLALQPLMFCDIAIRELNGKNTEPTSFPKRSSALHSSQQDGKQLAAAPANKSPHVETQPDSPTVVLLPDPKPLEVPERNGAAAKQDGLIPTLQAPQSEPFADNPSPAPASFDFLNAAYREFMRDVLMRWKFGVLPENYLTSEQFPIYLEEELSHRPDRFHRYMVPWVKRAHPLAGARVIEVGSGTGSATLAFAPYVHHIHCFELHENTKKINQERLRYFGIDNVTFENGIFDRSAPLLTRFESFDAVLLIAVLGHAYFHECREILQTAVQALRPGGVIVIAETPNRLSFRDIHSSRIDFFQWLPSEIQREYYLFSPRTHFVHDIGDTIRNHGPDSNEVQQRLVRWGHGVSFHDFELILGPKVHEMIALDGWEEEIQSFHPVLDDDQVLVDIFRRTNTKAGRAFARYWLYFVLRKPLDDGSTRHEQASAKSGAVAETRPDKPTIVVLSDPKLRLLQRVLDPSIFEVRPSNFQGF